MIHSKRLAIVGLFLLAAAPAVLADEVVHFSNGTFMKVQGYKIEGDMIRVVLGPDASMVFPTNLVESIERSGHTVYPQASSGPANVVVSGSGGAGGMRSVAGQYPQTGEGQVPARFRKGAAAEADSALSVVEEKEGVVRPNPGEYPMAGRRGVLRAVGRRDAPAGEALIDPTLPAGTPAKPRTFPSLAPRRPVAPPEPPPSETPPPEPPDDGAAESDGTASPD